MNRQHNGQKKKNKQRSAKHTHKTYDRVTRTPLNNGSELRCSDRVSNSCSTSGICRVNLVTNRGRVTSHAWGKDLKVFMPSGTYPWSFVTQIFHNGQPKTATSQNFKRLKQKYHFSDKKHTSQAAFWFWDFYKHETDFIGSYYSSSWLSWSHHFENFAVDIMIWLTIMEYLCHKWPRICSTWHEHFQVLSSCMTCHPAAV
jgi:hypothetical protein